VPSLTQLALNAVARVFPRAGLELIWRGARRTDPTLELADALVRDGDVVVDAGASYGLFTARFARLVGAGGRVHSFEPNPARHARLRGLARGRPVVIHPVGLSDAAGSARLEIPVIHGREFEERAQVRRGAGPVRLATLDAELGDDGGDVALIKIDVEGHEGELLRGAAATLAASEPALLVEIEQRFHDAPITTIFDQLADLGFAGWAITAGGLVPVADFDVERDQVGQAGEELTSAAYVNNFLFVRPGSEAAARAAALGAA
jgi:FkbM family methyltransferase